MPDAGARVAAFAWHEVTDDPAASGFQRPAARAYKHTRAAFGAHLDAIAGAMATAGAPAPTLVDALDARAAAGGRAILLTFDDGGARALDAAEALERRGWRGHFFIVTGLVGRRGFLDAAGVRALHARGHLIGSHSHTHPDIFRDLPPAIMREEWRVSIDALAQLLGAPCVAASVPGGDISAAALRSAAASGVRWLFTSEPWLTPRRVDDCRVLGRFCAKASTSPATIGELAAFHGWRRALVERRLRVAARRTAPALYRAWVRRATRPSTTHHGDVASCAASPDS